MKKGFLIVTLCCLSIGAASQDASYQKKFDNEFYFRFGYSLPFWNQYGALPSDWETGSKRIGFTGELGTIFMFKNIPSSDHMALGIDVDFLTVYWHKFQFFEDGSDVDLWNVRIDSKIGPSFTFRLVDRLAVDLFVKADFCWFTATGIMYDDDMDEMEGYADIFAVGLSTGFNVRYSVLMVGFEFNTINPQLENVEEQGEYLGNINDANSKKSPLPSVNFTLGLSF
jgi:hypothetical protein